jgi:hypothetical protein
MILDVMRDDYNRYCVFQWTHTASFRQSSPPTVTNNTFNQAIISDFKKDEKVLQDFTPTCTGAALPSIDLFVLDTQNWYK